MRRYSVSIIVPTYNERPNVAPLVEEVFAVLSACPQIDAEMIFVDDASPDGTGEAVEALAGHWPVRLVRRSGKQGLGGAVLAGFAASDRPLLCVMDGDLSHDPALLPRLVQAMADYDLAVGSRFGPGSGVERWTFGRKWLSLAGVWLARRLTGLPDPLSGYFCLRRGVLAAMPARPVSTGYKILLEICLAGGVRRACSLGYVFRQRRHSRSKLGGREYLLFIKQLVVHGARRLAAETASGGSLTSNVEQRRVIS